MNGPEAHGCFLPWNIFEMEICMCYSFIAKFTRNDHSFIGSAIRGLFLSKRPSAWSAEMI